VTARTPVFGHCVIHTSDRVTDSFVRASPLGRRRQGTSVNGEGRFAAVRAKAFMASVNTIQLFSVSEELDG
jgi:hypothetical protein